MFGLLMSDCKSNLLMSDCKSNLLGGTMSEQAPDAAPLTPATAAALVAAARAARQHAHAPYSQFQVGAALLDADGGLTTGCNVENASYGLTVCAERVAVFTAVASGRRRFTGLVVATSSTAPPCGACLQVLAEFCDDLPIGLVGESGEPVWHKLSELLPLAFRSAKTPGGNIEFGRPTS